MQGDFLYTVLVVAFDESIKSATRISSLYSFSSVIVGLILGGIVFKVRRLKPFIIAGTCLFMVAFGLLINYRGGTGSSSHSGIIGAQICLGIAGGMFPYPAQASIQAATKHERKFAVQLRLQARKALMQGRCCNRDWYLPRNIQHRKRARQHGIWRDVATDHPGRTYSPDRQLQSCSLCLRRSVHVRTYVSGWHFRARCGSPGIPTCAEATLYCRYLSFSLAHLLLVGDSKPEVGQGAELGSCGRVPERR